MAEVHGLDVAEVAPVGCGDVEAVRRQVHHATAQVRERAAVHAAAVLRQAALKCQPPQAVQLQEGSRRKHHLLHCRVEHQLQRHHRRQLVQMVGQAEGCRLCQPRPADARVQVLQKGPMEGKRAEEGQHIMSAPRSINGCMWQQEAATQ